MSKERTTRDSARESLLDNERAVAELLKKSVHDLPYRAPFDPNINQSHWMQTTLLLIAEVMG